MEQEVKGKVFRIFQKRHFPRQRTASNDPSFCCYWGWCFYVFTRRHLHCQCGNFLSARRVA